LCGKLIAPSNQHNFKRVDKDAKVKESIHVITLLENIPQPSKGFSVETVSCNCLSKCLKGCSLHVDDIKIFFELVEGNVG